MLFYHFMKYCLCIRRFVLAVIYYPIFTTFIIIS